MGQGAEDMDTRWARETSGNDWRKVDRPIVAEQQFGDSRNSLIGIPYNPDDDRFARLLDSQWEAGRKYGWNQCFTHHGLS